MGDPLAGMIPYDAIGLYEQPKPMFRFKMPRVVPEQKAKFESDELFRRLSRESEVVLMNPYHTPQKCTSILVIDALCTTKWKHTRPHSEHTQKKDLLIPTNCSDVN